MTQTVSNRHFFKAVLLLCEHGHFFSEFCKNDVKKPVNTDRGNNLRRLYGGDFLGQGAKYNYFAMHYCFPSIHLMVLCVQEVVTHFI